MSEKGIISKKRFAFLKKLIFKKNKFLQKKRRPKYRRDRRVIYKFDIY
jgi:hypothetical protein